MIRLNSTHGPSTLGSSTRSTSIERYAGGEFTRTSDFVSVEEPLLLVLNGRPFATLMRTPGQDVALIEGFLFTEGIVGAPEDIVRIEATAHPSSQEMAVELAAGCAVPEMDARASYLSSSCGVCGRASIAQLMNRIEAVKPMDIGLAFLVGLIPAFDAAQRDFRLTGGVHAAALFGQGGELIDLAEDVGRHNALDKLVGAAFRAGSLPLEGRVLVMSSRASFDIVQKAAAAGIPAIASMGAASSLAVDLARACGIALHSFLRPGSVVGFGQG